MPIELSVVIVTYKCLPFTELCLQSLLWSNDARMEVIVVDNNSEDGASEKIKVRYPGVKIITNTKNRGFGAACNQGMQIAKGRYYLMLNPDTVVPENLTQLILDFMHTHPQCGAMGVKMIDGGGNYLPESKRGIPTVFRAFFKFAGFSQLFPNSSVFSGYYLGHLPSNQHHEIEILAGAFMVLDAKVIKQTGGFDETFFMYGEDIDLSYRILKLGYKILYNPDMTILHFKGESTIKNRQYINSFYGAMDLFYRHHFINKNKRFRFLLVNASIYLFGAVAGIKNKVIMLIEKVKYKARFKGDWVWVTNDKTKINIELNPNQPSICFSGKHLGFKTTEEITKSASKTSICILSLSLLPPSEALENLKILSKKQHKCVWKDIKNEWLYIGWSASTRTVVKSLK